MRLTDEEEAMLTGDMGPHVQWAIDHQIKIGTFFFSISIFEFSFLLNLSVKISSHLFLLFSKS